MDVDQLQHRHRECCGHWICRSRRQGVDFCRCQRQRCDRSQRISLVVDHPHDNGGFQPFRHPASGREQVAHGAARSRRKLQPCLGRSGRDCRLDRGIDTRYRHPSCRRRDSTVCAVFAYGHCGRPQRCRSFASVAKNDGLYVDWNGHCQPGYNRSSHLQWHDPLGRCAGLHQQQLLLSLHGHSAERGCTHDHRAFSRCQRQCQCGIGRKNHHRGYRRCLGHSTRLECIQ